VATEKLKFKIELYATMWHKPPHAEILINDVEHFDKDITGSEENPDVIEFEQEFTEGVENCLTIKRSGKGIRQTVLDEKGDILYDQLLHIKSIEIDEINLEGLVYEGEYTPNYPQPWATQQRKSGIDLKDSFKNVTQMGFDGEWKLKFSTPFYMWLLENLY
tara:strand:+ start:998 stop:1480 length:483 start_codon:yes stop_codon:yes gene_type:complete